MPHVTFIHGISNKPPPDPLLEAWLRALGHDGGPDLGAEGVSASMVYWADVMYEKPMDEAGYESVEDLESIAAGAADPTTAESESAWRDTLGGEQKQFMDALSAKTRLDTLEREAPPRPAARSGPEFERVFLPWFIKREIMKEFLRDVHHYLFNVRYSPRPANTYQVQTEIRQRTLQALNTGAERRPHIVVSHSMGTVIAYDCLKRVPDCPPVDGLMTIGSPLAIDEVQDKLAPECTRQNGFPEKVTGPWINVYDSLDPVTGFDWDMANDFLKNGQEVVEVINEQNWGAWRHSITKYLSGPRLRDGLRRLLGL